MRREYPVLGRLECERSLQTVGWPAQLIEDNTVEAFLVNFSQASSRFRGQLWSPQDSPYME
jgi:hypothetical protein